MNPLLKEALGSIVRAGLQNLAGVLVAHGYWKASEAEMYVGGATLAILTLGWSIWQKYGMRLKLVTALVMPQGATENEVTAVVNNPSIVNPPVSLPKDQAPNPLTLKETA